MARANAGPGAAGRIERFRLAGMVALGRVPYIISQFQQRGVTDRVR